MAPITEKTSPLPSKLKWLSSLKGNGTHNALWVTCDPFCLFWSDTTCHGKLDWPAHLKMCTFIFNFTGLLVAKYWLFLGEVSPQNFPWNWPIFLRICPENPSKFDFFLLKSREIGRFFCEFWLFSRENPAKSADFWANFDFFPAKLADFSANLPRKSREILLFSAKYQKPWLLYQPSAVKLFSASQLLELSNWSMSCELFKSSSMLCGLYTYRKYLTMSPNGSWEIIKVG